MSILKQNRPKSKAFWSGFPIPRSPFPKNIEGRRRLLSFLCVAGGILGRWLWSSGWAYVEDPSAGLELGPPLAIAVRILLSLIAATLTFVATYEMIDRMADQKWKVYFYAFMCGFMWLFGFESMQR